MSPYVSPWSATTNVCGAMKRVDHNTVRTCTLEPHPEPIHVHERPGHRTVWVDVNPDRPLDCTCSGWHTDDCIGMPMSVVRILAQTEDCPAERRALQRIMASRI